MTESNSTPASRQRKAKKPKKPHKDFPLTPHPSGRWCKKITFQGKAKLHYFGSWKDDPKGTRALDRWLAEKDALLAGRVPRARQPDDNRTLGRLIEAFLLTKGHLRDAGELSPHTWDAYADVCDELLGAFGQDRLLLDLLPEDFERLRTKWAKRWGPVRLASEINRARVVFNYAHKNRIIPSPIVFGEGFKRPSQKVLRLNRASKGARMFEADELLRMIESASQPLKTMLLLAINCALGNADVARLPLSALDLDKGWLTYPRPKTGIMRRCPLWPETIRAVRDWLTQRPGAQGPGQLRFAVHHGARKCLGQGDRRPGRYS